MKICVTGGCGYIGSMLVPRLLADGHEVTVIDTQWFGAGHPANNPNLSILKVDIRQVAAWQTPDAVIHLASLSNNDMYAVKPYLTVAVNRFLPCERLIYASSVAAYGSSDAVLSEDAPMKPTTPYGVDKVFCEDQVLAAGGTVVRAASVCGPSMNMRFDLTVNRLVRDAVMLDKMTVNGGSQKRCHIHMHDICDFYRLLLKAPKEKIAGEAFNVVAENDSVLETAMVVARTLKSSPKIDIGPATDDRSYMASGDKAREVLGFVPKKRVENAILEMETRLLAGYWRDAYTNENYMRLM